MFWIRPIVVTLACALLIVPTSLVENRDTRASAIQVSEMTPPISPVVLSHFPRPAGFFRTLVSLNVTVHGDSGPIDGATVNASNPVNGWYTLNNTTTNGVTTMMVEPTPSLVVAASQLVNANETLTGQVILNATSYGLPVNVTVDVTRPEVPPLKVSLESTNGTCPWNGHTRMLPIASGGVGAYNFTWMINGVANRSGPYYNLTVGPSGVTIAVTVLSSGKWFGQQEAPPPVTSPQIHVQGTCGFNVSLNPAASGMPSPIGFSWSGNASHGYVMSSDGVDTLFTDVGDNSNESVWATLPSWVSELAYSAGYVPPWQEVLIGEGNVTNETGVVLQPQQSGMIVAELPSQIVDCMSGGKIVFGLSPMATKAVAADLITLVYADLGVLDPIEHIDPDHGFVAEIVQAEILSLSEQGVLSLLDSDLQSGQLSEVLQSLFTVVFAIAEGVLDLPSVIWGAGYDYLTNFLHLGSGDAWREIAEGIGRIASAAVATESDAVGYGLVGAQWASLVEAGFIAPTNETVDVPEFSCNGIAIGPISVGVGPYPWLSIPLILILASVLVGVVVFALKDRKDDEGT